MNKINWNRLSYLISLLVISFFVTNNESFNPNHCFFDTVYSFDFCLAYAIVFLLITALFCCVMCLICIFNLVFLNSKNYD